MRWSSVQSADGMGCALVKCAKVRAQGLDSSDPSEAIANRVARARALRRCCELGAKPAWA